LKHMHLQFIKVTNFRLRLYFLVICLSQNDILVFLEIKFEIGDNNERHI